jgi:hypothetical protein
MIIRCLLLGLITSMAPPVPTRSARAGELEDAIAQADRLDPGWQYRDILRKRHDTRPPDERNSVLQAEKALALLPEHWQDPQPGDDARPSDPAEIPRGFRLVQSLAAVAPNQTLTAYQLAGLRAELDTVRPALSEARRLIDFPEGQTVFAPSKNPLATLLPYAQSSRKVARLLQQDVTRRLADGDPAGAIASVEALLNLSATIGDEPTLISQLVRIAYDQMAVESTLRVVGQTVAPPRSLADLQARLLQESDVPWFLYGVRGERATYFDLLDKLATGEIKQGDLGGDNADFLQTLKDRALGIVSQPFYRHNQALGLRLLTEVVELAKRTTWEQPELLDRWNDTLFETCKGKRQNGMVSLMMPAFDSAALACYRNACYLRCTAVAAACERYRQDAGQWPDTIDALVPRYLAELPLDPYTGQQLHFKRNPDGVVVYGLGLDRHDDAGRLQTKLESRPGFDVGVQIFDVERRGVDQPKDEANQPPRDRAR